MFTLLSTSARAARPALLALLLALASAPQDAAAQPAAGSTQTLVIGYPNPGVPSGKSGSPLYKGLVYVTIVPANGSAPVASAQLAPSQRDVRALPLGSYEVRYAVRNGSELKTFIVRDVILRADRGNTLTVEVNLDAPTTIVGGDLSVQQMATLIRQLQAQVSTLEGRVSTLTSR